MPKDDTVKPTVNTGSQPSVVMPPVLTDDITPPSIPDVKPTTHEEVKLDTGSAAPSNDIVMPTQEISSTPRKKFAGGKVIATILGLFLLVGGVGAGVYLTGQNQNPQERASEGCPYDTTVGQAECTSLPNIPDDCPGCTIYCDTNDNCQINQADGITMYPGSEFRLVGSGGGGGATCSQDFIVNCPAGQTASNTIISSACIADVNLTRCDQAGISNGIGSAQRLGDCCAYWSDAEGGGCRKTTVNTYACGLPADCKNITIRVDNNNAPGAVIPEAELNTLKAGDIVQVCVKGSDAVGSYDKARFKVNNGVWIEIINNDGQDLFCKRYTIPTDITTFTIESQIHKKDGTWKS